MVFIVFGKERLDVFFVEGYGRVYLRGYGLVLYIGFVLGILMIGILKWLLRGILEGLWVKVGKVYVSVGYFIDLFLVVEVVKILNKNGYLLLLRIVDRFLRGYISWSGGVNDEY